MSQRIVEESVRIERVVHDVFGAWSSGSAIATWFAPMAIRPPMVDLSFEVGGSYRIEMDLGPGGIHLTEGRFLEIAKDERIRMTWRCDAWDDPPSVVEVTFTPDGEDTIVHVRHAEISSSDALEGQIFGWQGCLAQLRTVLLNTPQGATE